MRGGKRECCTNAVIVSVFIDPFYRLLWFRNATDSNVQHVVEVNSARVAAEEDVAKNSEDLIERFDGEL